MSAHSLLHEVTVLLKRAERAAFPNLDFSPDVAQSKDPAFGDYQCNSAMKLTKQLSMPPASIAQALVQAFPPEASDLFERVDIAGPGFINMKLRPSHLTRRLWKNSPPKCYCRWQTILRGLLSIFLRQTSRRRCTLATFGRPIIGESLCRIFEALGHDVVRLNHVGDWGTAFGMLIAHMKSLPDFSIAKVLDYTLTDLMRLYRESKVRFDEDPGFKKTAQLEVVRLQGGEEEALKIWKVICDISKRAYQEIYSLLDVSIQVRGESYYNPVLPSIVSELEQKGLVTISDGAKCLFVEGCMNREGNPLPLMLQKSDGGYTYDTTDIGGDCPKNSRGKG